MTAADIVVNTSELIAILCAVGIATCALRWSSAVHRNYLFAFGVFLLGSMIREVTVHYYGVTGWPPDALVWSGVSRLIQIAGIALFIRASLAKVCGEWGWIAVLVVAMVGAWLIR